MSEINCTSLIKKLKSNMCNNGELINNDEFVKKLIDSGLDKLLKRVDDNLRLSFVFDYNVYFSLYNGVPIFRSEVLKKIDRHINHYYDNDVHNTHFINSFESRIYFTDFDDRSQSKYLLLPITIINNIIYLTNDFDNYYQVSIFDLDDFSTELYLNTFISKCKIPVHVSMFIDILKIYTLAYNNEISITYIDFSYDLKFQKELIKLLTNILE